MTGAQSSSLQRLRDNRLMRSPPEVTAFEAALAEVGADRGLELARDLHLILDDGCHHQEVMFGLVHLLESFEVEAQLQALLDVLPRLVEQAPWWTNTLHLRILNDAEARSCYQRLVSGASEPCRSAARKILAAIARQGEEPLKSAATSILKATPRGESSWEEIYGFDSPSEYQRFVEFIERQVAGGVAVEVPADPSYGPGMLFGGRWFREVATGEIWRLVPPDPPFLGVWEPVRR